jgi:hypothetical protein
METITVTPDTAAVPEERQSQLEYWKHHVAIEATVETMMLDSQAAVIDEMERPEILGKPCCAGGLRPRCTVACAMRGPPCLSSCRAPIALFMHLTRLLCSPRGPAVVVH